MSRTVFLRPDSSLVFRSGRPFGAADASGGADSFAFPMPATVAGALRAAWCDAVGHTHQAHDQLLQRILVRGPLACTRARQPRLWLPRPLDAILVASGDRREWRRLSPDPHAQGCGSDLPLGLLPVQGVVPDAVADAPAYWSSDAVANWLAGGLPGTLAAGQSRAAFPSDRRIHNQVDSQRQQVVDGALYFSKGIEFAAAGDEEEGAAEHGLLMWVDAPAEVLEGFSKLNRRHFRLGADGRNAACLELDPVAPLDGQCPAGPNGLAERLDGVKQGGCIRLMLATPACYLRNGWYPDGLVPVGAGSAAQAEGELVGLPGWRFRLVAAALGRFLAAAGIGMRNSAGERQSTIRPLRHLVPAGSVYWLEVLQRGDTNLSSRWLQSTCRTEYARDGHGLGLFGLA